jgi:hypothetical protein
VNIKNYNTFVSKEITTYKVDKEMEKMESLTPNPDFSGNRDFHLLE